MKNINILDFDDSITAQTDFVTMFKHHINISNLRRFQHAARLWSSPKNFAEICITAFCNLKPGFTLMGSGDFHHYSLALIKQYKAPLTIVLFDNHPDWMQPPHQYHCGTWVYSLARLPHVERIIIIGLESGDINGKSFKSGDVESYLNQKIILLPYEPVIAEIIGSKTSTLHSLLKSNLQAGITEIISHIATQQVYISVDKDCLRLEDAFTNWEQGSLPLATVVETIIAIKKKFEIVGADTVGDYSAPKFRSPLKWLGSLLDRKISRKPHVSVGLKSELKRNELANIALFNALAN